MIKKLWLIFSIQTFYVFAGINFKDQSSTVEFSTSSGKLTLRTPIAGFKGRLKLPDSLTSRTAQSNSNNVILFEGGLVYTGSGDVAFTGTFIPGSANSLSLSNSSNLDLFGSKLSGNVSVAAGEVVNLTGMPFFAGPTTLGSSTSELKLGIISKMDQNIVLNGGKVTLTNDLKFKDNANFSGSGTIDVADRTLHLSGGNTQTGTVTYLNAGDIQLTGDQTTSGGGASVFSGVGLTSLVNGNGYTWTLTTGGKIQVGPNHKLILNSLRINGLGGIVSNGYFDVDPTATLALYNVKLDLAANYTHGAGTISIEGDKCKLISRGNTFTVQNANTRLRIDGQILTYDLSTFDATPFSFTNLFQHQQLVNGGTIMPEFGIYRETLSISATSYTLTQPIDLNSVNTITFTNTTPGTPKAVTFDGVGLSIKFPNTFGSFINLATNVQLTLQNVVLENFNPAAISYGGVSSTISFGDGVLIKLAKDFSIAPADRAWAFVGNATLDAQNNKLTIDGSSRMTLTGSSKTLTIKNANLQFLSSQPLAVNTASATVALDNSNLTLSSSGHNFSTGNLNVVNQVNLKGSWNIPNGLIFSSAGNMTIKSGATLTLTNTATLQYQANPANDGTNTAATKRHLVMEDATSTLKLVGSTLTSTDTGIVLDQGNLIFEGDCTINSSATATAALELSSNVNIQIKDSAAANFYGPVIYG